MSVNEEEVLKIKKKLDKINARIKDDGHADLEKAVDLLKRLESMKMSLSILTKTRVGMTVNSLRKSTDDDKVVALSKVIIKAWKKLVPRESGGSSSSSSGGSKDDRKDRRKSNDSNGSGGDRGDRGSGLAPDTHDQVRLSCRRLLSAALKGGEEEIEGLSKSPEELAALIEDAIFRKQRQDTGMKYKNQVRSRVFNLKDKKNPGLRMNVLLGLIAPDKIATMTAEEMASDEMKNLRNAAAKEGMDAARLAIKEGTKTDLLKCGKCLKNNCTYNQLQTRSADEPMTTFVMCNECGHRWKFC